MTGSARLQRCVGVFAALLLLMGCRRPAPGAAPVPTLEIEVAGCSTVRNAAEVVVCEVGDARTLRLVLPAAASGARVHLDATELATTTDKTDGPVLTIEVPAITTRSKLIVEATVGGARARTTIEIGPTKRLDWVDEARAARTKGDADRASSLAIAHAGDGGESGALAKGALARQALARGRADEAFPLFREAIDLHRSAGRVSDAADDAFALAFALHQRSQRYTEARAVLDGAASDVALYAEGRARDPYYRGILAGETGDHRRALGLLEEAERRARRLGMTRLKRNARSALGLELVELGRAQAALPLFASLEAELDEAARSSKSDTDACERIEVANNRGWAATLANEANAERGEPPGEAPRPALERALAMTGCTDAYVRSFALANLARVSLADGDVAASEKHLAAAKAGIAEPRGTEHLAWLDLTARQLLASGRPRDALRVLDDALAFARAALLRIPEWSLLFTRAEALEALDRSTEAIDALRSAEEVLDDATRLVPLGEGRGAFAGGRSRSARALVGLLVKTHRLREAAATGRHAQARVLASVERALRISQLAAPERARWEEAVRSFRTARAAIDTDAASDWKLAADALARAARSRTEREHQLRAALEAAMAVVQSPAREPSAADGGVAERMVEPRLLELDIYPAARSPSVPGLAFVALATDARGTSVHPVPTPAGETKETLAHALFDDLQPSLETAERVRVRTYGAWRGVDIHALPWRGEPLVAHVAVEYAIGLPSSRPSAGSQSGPALVIGDPTGDLPGALAEAREAAAALRATARVELLVREAATSRSVTSALRGAALLHYAGHGVFAGNEGWESELPLAAGGRLAIADVFALAPTPRTVILAGCEAATTSGDAEGLGLAQAFIVAGSAEVLAPVRRVPDALTARLASGLYSASPAATLTAPLAVRARAASLALRKTDPSSDWAAFRVLVP